MGRENEEALLAEPVYGAKLDAIAAVPTERRAAALNVFSGPSVDLHRWAIEQRSRTTKDADGSSRQQHLVPHEDLIDSTMLSAQSQFLTEHMRIFGLERSAIANRVVVMTEDDLERLGYA